MLKAIVPSLDVVPEGIRGEYKPIEGGQGFALDLDAFEAHPSVGALKRAKDREATEATSAKSALKAATEALEALKGEHEKLSGEFEERLRGAIGNKADDLAKLDEKWGTKLKKANDEAATEIAKRDAALQKVLVTDRARAIIANLKPAEPEYVDVLLPFVVQRLGVEMLSDGARTRVLDADGKPSADTIEELTQQFAVDKRFSPLLTGSKATGGSANGGNGKSGNGSAPAKIDLSKATIAEKEAYYKARREAGA